QSVAPFDALILGGNLGVVYCADIGPVDGCERLRALAQQPRPAGLVKLPLDTPNDGLAFDLIADQERIAQCGRRIVGKQNVRGRGRGGPGGWRRRRRGGGRAGGGAAGGRAAWWASPPLPGFHFVRRADAQDQRPP